VSFASGTVVECFVFGFGFSLGFLFLPAPFMFYGDQIKYYEFYVSFTYVSFTVKVSFILVFEHEWKVLLPLVFRGKESTYRSCLHSST